MKSLILCAVTATVLGFALNSWTSKDGYRNKKKSTISAVSVNKSDLHDRNSLFDIDRSSLVTGSEALAKHTNFVNAEVNLKQVLKRNGLYASDAEKMLIQLYKATGDVQSELSSFRDFFEGSHPWHSQVTAEMRLAGEYSDLARDTGNQPDELRADTIVLKGYRPADGEPPFNYDYSDPQSVHGYACAARALYRRWGENGIELAEEAVRTLPNDGAIRWVLANNLADARRYPESARQYAYVKKLGLSPLARDARAKMKHDLLEAHGLDQARLPKVDKPVDVPAPDMP